jgi:diadenosine tetraphosphate (Ap4A) HIT family hydrolase
VPPPPGCGTNRAATWLNHDIRHCNSRSEGKELAFERCELCDPAAGDTLWQDDLCRVVLIGDRDYPGFCRVILNRHVSEMTDLDAATRQELMRVVFATEQALRQLIRPSKINLASLGNVVPHLHWHVIPRFADDRHFPGAIWSEAQRPGMPRSVDSVALKRELRSLLQAVAE